MEDNKEKNLNEDLEQEDTTQKEPQNRISGRTSGGNSDRDRGRAAVRCRTEE